MVKIETNNQYHSESGHLSSTFIRMCADNPKKTMFGDKEKKEAYRIGSAYHSLIEGINDFEIMDYDKRPESDKAMNSKKNQEWKKSFSENYITVEEKSELEAMKNELFNHEFVSKLMTNNRDKYKELSIYGEIEGVKVKCRPDFMVDVDDTILIVDWKTTKEISERSIKNDFYYRYKHAAVIYSDLVKHEFNKSVYFMFVYQEKIKPFDVLPVLVSSDMMNTVKQEVYSDIKTVSEFVKAGNYPGISYKYDKNYMVL